MDACDRTIEYLRSCGMLCYKPGIAKGKSPHPMSWCAAAAAMRRA